MVKQSILKIENFTTLNTTLLFLLFLSIKGVIELRNPLFGYDRHVASKEQVGETI